MRALTKQESLFFTILCLNSLLTLSPIASLEDDLSFTPDILVEGNMTIVSPCEVFELGFFKPGNTSGWYLGIWYKNVQNRTVVWVANRDTPLSNSSGALLMTGDHGNIVLLDPSRNVTWSSNHTQVLRPNVLLLDTGNLVIKEGTENSQTFFWQSFDYPTHILLPDMKLGWNLSTGLNRYLTSWKSSEDPSTGDFSIKLDYHGFPEIFLWDKHVKNFRTGPWNGMIFSGVPEMCASKHGVDFNFVTKQDEVYYSFSLQNKLELEYSGLTVSPNGDVQQITWVESTKMWNIFQYPAKDQCDSYGECGPFGICDTNASPVCKCVRGFQPKNLEAWNLGNGFDGCVRKRELRCTKDKFLRLRSVKLPESGGAFVDGDMSLEACKEKCLENCSCSAYCNMEITNGGRGCVMWFGELMDMRVYADGGQDLYVRLAPSEIGGDGKETLAVIIVVAIVGLVILLAGLGFYIVWKRNLRISRNARTQPKCPYGRSQVVLLNEVVFTSKDFYSGERINDEPELALIDFSTVAVATNNFSDENLLGEGGFGYVYKGTLTEGQEIAVKRLSKNSGQGTEEFKNELKLIARLQHINLVRLLACCIDKDEQMLIYEYMENKSLDAFLFSGEKRSTLDWQKRYNIICGIARGLVYLHQDSRFRIIHRDLKASNILLDGEFTPKISDFGMARIFGKDQNESHTRRVVGTYGYMSPEYAMDGFFSTKSDVFSFGVLVLEIISGKMNKGFFNYSDNKPNLLDCAWKQWKEGKGLEIVDSSLGNSYCPSEVLRCIQVGLLCVQEHVVDRPTMSSVVFMLSSPDATMPQPKTPGFCLGRSPAGQTDSSSSKLEGSRTIDQVTIAALDGR
ncbi:hypothetical protein L3X38_021149 [Prunus dulcis]|uniref:Receptor-like serine/threonine-protein kinase n=2 Tax=Prunus dulcis TaxID=3755 RepID=A0AAD4VTR5_PRUDU|nr:receptor-like serine/threonine-protein kinase SD1-8 [Prunus dulcis]KAI5331023.1 hypothetical protein L3X38_021149 [Prunus dulcis]